MIRKLTLLSLLIVVFAETASAIVVRHDRKDSEYKSYGASFPMVCRVGDGMGTLIDSLWVVTAAHVADGLTGSKPYVTFGQRRIGVASIILHPEYRPSGNEGDLALIKLQVPVNDIYMAQLYRRNDELKKSIVIVGDGQGGDGISGVVEGKRILRAAENTIESVSEDWLRYTFDVPPTGDTLEGIGGPGDNGGPMIMVAGDTLYVLGVNVYNVGDRFLYGTQEYYTRISTKIAWIYGVMSGKESGIERLKPVKQPETVAVTPTAVVKDTNLVDIPLADDAQLLAILGTLAGAVESQSTERFLSLLSPRLIAESGEKPEKSFELLAKAQIKHGAINGYHDLPRQGSRVPGSAFPMRPVVIHFVDGYAAFLGMSINGERQIDYMSLSLREGICKSGLACRRTHDLSDVAKIPR